MYVVVQEEQLRKELRDLRKRFGLTPARLKSSPGLMEIMGGGNLKKAYSELLGLILNLGSSIQAKALLNAYELEVNPSNNAIRARPSTGRLLTARQDEFMHEQGIFDRKTVITYENAAIEEVLAAITMWVAPRSDSELPEYFVSVAVQIDDKGRIVLCNVSRHPLGQDDDDTARQLNTSRFIDGRTYQNASRELSLPVILWALPDDWRPSYIFFAIRGVENKRPKAVYGVAAYDWFSVMTMHGEVEAVDIESAAALMAEVVDEPPVVPENMWVASWVYEVKPTQRPTCYAIWMQY